MRKLLSMLYDRSPRQNVIAINQLFGRSQTVKALPHPYFEDLTRLLWRFTQQSNPTITHEDFSRLLLYGIDRIEHTLRTLQATLDMFHPDYRDDLPAYYAFFNDLRLVRFMSYAHNSSFVEQHFLAPYREAYALGDDLHVLEVGGGLPHGFLYNALYAKKFASLTVVEIESRHLRFLEWFCAEYELPLQIVLATAGETTPLPRNLPPIDFVFAKDIFEHLDDPQRMIDEIHSVVAPTALLALDLEDKPVGGEHISPQLSHLEAYVQGLGYDFQKKVSMLSLYRQVGS